MAQIELERSIVEELHTIEAAISDRFQRNPEVYPGYNDDTNSNLQNKKKRSFREVLLQQHEVSKLAKYYETQKARLETLRVSKEHELDVKSIEDPVFELKKFDEMFQSIKNGNTNDNSIIVKDFGAILQMKSSKAGILSEFASDIDLSTMFSGEEYFGKYLDLIKFHETWLNFVQDKINYVKYLTIFDDFDNEINTKIVKKKEYLNYLIELNGYLIKFVEKTQPLFDLEKFVTRLEDEYNRQEKSQTVDDGLFCQACNKQFAKLTVYNAHLTGKKHLKNSSSQSSKDDKPAERKNRTYQYYEFKISKIMEDILNKNRQDTKLNTERRKALTEKERVIEITQLEKEEELSDDDDEEKQEQQASKTQDGGIYNPLNLPIGPDGQPIPYWLWKLHGLGIEHTCEICGEYSYKGRKAFEKHFLEPRHIHGLRCLGITPSLVFRDITSIKQAVELWNKIKREKRLEEGERENAVEVEDEEGNVMSEKVYNDLKKQGLI